MVGSHSTILLFIFYLYNLFFALPFPYFSAIFYINCFGDFIFLFTTSLCLNLCFFLSVTALGFTIHIINLSQCTSIICIYIHIIYNITNIYCHLIYLIFFFIACCIILYFNVITSTII